MHGANRLGGNGVANSTVFGGIAGDVMPRLGRGQWPGYRAADADVLDAEIERALHAVQRRSPATQCGCAKTCSTLMWDDVGVMRDAAGLDARHRRDRRDRGGAAATGIADSGRRLQSDLARLAQSALAVRDQPRDCARGAQARQNSRGAHFRSDFPDPGDLATSRFTVARQTAGKIEMTDEPVEFTHVKPGETLIRDQIAAE